MLSFIATAIAVVGGAGVILGLLWIASKGDQDRVDEEDARDFFDAHGHWPDEEPDAAALHRGEVPYDRVDRPSPDGSRAETV